MKPRGVIWAGRATEPALAVPCPTCHAEIERACSAEVFPLLVGSSHLARQDFATVLGFRAVEPPAGLFEVAQ